MPFKVENHQGDIAKLTSSVNSASLSSPSSEVQFSLSWVRIQMHFCMHFGLVCSAGRNPPEEKQTRDRTAGNWHFACLNAALQRKTEQIGRMASPQLLQSVHLFMASCWNFPAPLMESKRKYFPTSLKKQILLQQHVGQHFTSAVKLETSSHMCSLDMESAKASLPKPGSLEAVYMSCHPGTSSPLALTEAVLIRRLFANTVPPEYWRILMLLKDSNAAQRILQQTAHCMQDTVSGGVICRFVMWTRDYM